jgi:hypothetical protein
MGAYHRLSFRPLVSGTRNAADGCSYVGFLSAFQSLFSCFQHINPIENTHMDALRQRAASKLPRGYIYWTLFVLKNADNSS